MRVNLKYIIIRLVLVVTILVGSNIIYLIFFYQSDLVKHADVLAHLNSVITDADVLYFGESSNFTYSLDDLDKRKISHFIEDYYPSLVIKTVDNGALHSGIYLTLLKNIPDTAKVKTVIITMNLRSFGADWINSKLETPLMKMNEFINPYLPKIVNRFFLSLKTFNNITEEERMKLVKKQWKRDKLNIAGFKYNSVYEWDKEIFKIGVLDSTGNRDEAKTNMTLQYVKNFAFKIDTFTNPRIKDFDEICALCKTKGWNIVYNIVAENIEKAELLCGVELRNILNENQDLLVKRYSTKGAKVVDNLEAIKDDFFIDKDFPTEHYNEYGRRIVARNVALKLKEVYNEEFIINE